MSYRYVAENTGYVCAAWTLAVAPDNECTGLDIETIHDEYHTYSDPKARFWDEVFFENFDLNTVMWLARREGWILSNIEVAPPSPPPSPVSLLDIAKSSA